MPARRCSPFRRQSLALVLLLTLTAGARAAYVEHTLTFRERELALAKLGTYDIILLRDCDITREAGRPQLPVLSLTLAIPQGARATRLEVLEAESRELVERFTPLPAQAPQILPTPGVEPPPWAFVEADPSVYGRSEPYPSAVAEITSTGRLPSNEAVGVSVYPLQYIPDARSIRFFSRITLRLHYEHSDAGRRPVPEAKLLRQVVRALVANDSQFGDLLPRARVADSRLEAGDFEYVIVTSPELAASFAPLAEWKTRKGIPATTVTVDWIDASYSGADTQERIRAFIADARESWGAIFYLLGGDTQIVPARRAYAMTCEAGGHADEDAIGCDLYYADLDGTWDDDGDGTYGEIADGVDLYPDVFVGRAPVTAESDVENFVSKVISYERAPEAGHCLSMLMAGEVLWTDPFTDSGIGLNMIDRESVPPRFDPITKLYQTLGNESVSSVISALNSGKAHFLHDGHAWYSLMGCGTGYLERSQVDKLTNGPRLPLVYSIGCWPAAFDLESTSCIAEHFVNAPHGGAVAFIGNSRYGWGAPGNPGYGHSDRFMQKFYSTIFGDGPVNAAAALAVAKAAFVPFSQEENVYRWHQYQLNLLGDPEMPIWTDEPAPLAVTHPDSLVAGSSVFDVAVWDARGPVENALVCLMNSVDIYQRATTGEDGIASLLVETAVPESVDLTVTAHDRQSYEARITVDIAGAYLRVDDLVVDDSVGGNDDGLAGPGETIEIELTLRNAGTSDAGSVLATLSANDPCVEILTGSASYGDIAAGTAVAAFSAFRLQVADDCSDGHVVPLDVTITADGVRRTWTAGAALTIAAPVLAARSYSVDDTRTGDGDGTPEPGERLRLMVEIENTGMAPALAPEVVLSSNDPRISVVDASATLPDVGSGDVVNAVFAIEIDESCPAQCFPSLDIEAETRDGQTCVDAILIAVGSAGLADDFESGAHGWTHMGDNDLWTLTDIRVHSGQSSWYCGSPAIHEYTDDMDARLESPAFVLGAGAELSFWCWYEVPIYHEDGLYVELLSGGAAVDTLDFIGSGGALGQLGTIGNDWLEYRYEIDHPAGDTVQVRFRFATDGADVAEGVYIDDVTVSTGTAPSGYSIPGDDAGETPIVLHQNRPNPFTPHTDIGFTMAADGPVTLSVYNIQGRLIRTLLDEARWAGEHSAFWDGKDELGVDVAAGVYMCRLSFGEHEATRKMILVR